MPGMIRYRHLKFLEIASMMKWHTRTVTSFFKSADLYLPLTQSLWQVPVILFMALLLALSTNHWRSDGIPLRGDWSVDNRFSDDSGSSLAISLDRAEKVFERKDGVFLDARPVSQYTDGHIRGALNIPWEEVDRFFMEAYDRLEKTEVIITYCDGESCNLSHELALFLKEMGFGNVHVLVNGWTVWQEAGLPVSEQ